jgi:hypothetical protein
VRLYLDECIDWRLARDIVGHDVRTAFVTVDRNLAFQQNVSALSLAVVVLRARSNRLGELRLMLDRLHSGLRSAPRGQVTFVH